MALAAQLIFLFFSAGTVATWPVQPTSAQAGPSSGHRLPSATETTAATPHAVVGCPSALGWSFTEAPLDQVTLLH
jgi:hypothetical protein